MPKGPTSVMSPIKTQLLDDIELPAGMSYPRLFRKLVEGNLAWLEPWWVLDAADTRRVAKGLAQRYPATRLVPFARRQDNDDVACFELESPGKVIIIHDYASAGWERREVFPDFHAWLRRAVEDVIEWDSVSGDAE